MGEVSRASRWTVGRRLVVACLCCAVIPLLGYAVFTYTRTARALSDLEHARFVEREVAVSQALDDLTAEELAATGKYAEWSAFAAAMARGDSTWIREQLTSLAGTRGAFAQVYGPDGRLLLAVGSAAGARSLLRLPETMRARGEPPLAGVPTTGFETLDGRLSVVSAELISGQGDGSSPAGLLVIGRPVDERMLATIDAATDVHVSLAAAKAVAGKQTAAPGGASVAVLNQVGPPFDDGRYRSVYLAVYDSDGYRTGLVKVAMDRAVVLSATSDLRTMAVVALLVALLCGALAALLLSRHISTPLRGLATAAVAIAGGDTRQRIEVRSNDEVGQLAGAFNTMSERITDRVTDLSEKIGSLTDELTDLNVDFGETLTDTVNVEAELKHMIPRVAAMMKADAAVVYLREDGGGLRPAASGPGSGGTSGPAESMAARVVASGEPDALLPDQVASGDGGVCSLAAAPLVRAGDVAGALVVVTHGLRSYDQQDTALLVTLAGQVAVAVRNADMYGRLEKSYLATVAALAGAIETKDDYAPEHPRLIADMCEAVGERLELSDADLRLLRYAAILHDVGKIGVPERILRKPAGLTDEEFSVVAGHTVIGESIVSRIDYLRPVGPVIRAAHERWDGAGYPDGLSGAGIPLASRIVFVCDAYHAMTSDRPYRKALSRGAALAAVRDAAGTRFDPDVVAAFVAAGDAVEAAYSGAPRREREVDRVLATVLFIDIVDSTVTAADMGDEAWRDLLRRFRATVATVLSEYRGTEIDAVGDGLFVRFDGVARAVRCAAAISQALEPLDLRIRAGCHTGEIELIDGEVHGLAVHIGARVADLAGPGEILVSETVRDLVAGSGLTFADRGEHELRGVPGLWRIYVAQV